LILAPGSVKPQNWTPPPDDPTIDSLREVPSLNSAERLLPGMLPSPVRNRPKALMGVWNWKLTEAVPTPEAGAIGTNSKKLLRPCVMLKPLLIGLSWPGPLLVP